MFGFVHNTNNIEISICKHSNVLDSKVFGFDIPSLDFRFKITADKIKERRFYFGFFLLGCKRQNSRIRNHFDQYEPSLSLVIFLTNLFSKDRKLEMAQKQWKTWRITFYTAQNATKTTEILPEKLSTIGAISQTSVSSYAYV